MQNHIGNDKRASIEGSSPGAGFWIPVAKPTSRYLCACPDLDYFRIADHTSRIARPLRDDEGWKPGLPCTGWPSTFS
jgi:hypothetical protein